MDFEINAADGFPWDKVNAAKRYLYAVKPWWARFGEHLKIVPIYQPPTGNQPYGATTSTDRQFRLYVDRAYALNKPIHILAGALEHEFQQHTRNTFNRLRHLSEEDWAEFANIAFNLEINGGMDAEQRSLEMKQVQIMCERSKVFSKREMELWNVQAPPGLDDEGWIPRLIPLPDGLSAEEYFTILKKSKEEQEKRERQEREKQKQEEEKQKQDSEDEPEPQDDAGDQEESGDDIAPESSEGDQEDESHDPEDGEDSEPEEGGSEEGADSDSTEDSEDGDPGDGSDSPDESGEQDGDSENSGSSTSDHKDDADPDDADTEVNDSEGAEDLSDGGESDGSEDSQPEGDPDESEAKDSGSAGGNHSADQKGEKPSDSKGENGNESQPTSDDSTGAQEGSDFQPSDEEPTGEATEESDKDGKGEGKPGDERVIPTAEIADAVEALKEKLDQRLWAKELENPADEMTSAPWKPDERENEKPVDRLEISEAMEELGEDVLEANDLGNFGLNPGNHIVNWTYRQQKIKGVDWQSRLIKLLSSNYTSAKVSGASDLSYSVRNPNQPEFGAILQGLHDYAPIIYVIQDVSASMRNNKRQSKSMSAFTDLGTKVLGTFNTKLTWITVDTDIVDIGQASGWSKSLQRKMSYGFGGTKIGPIIEATMNGKLAWKGKKYPKPDFLVVVTDCGFNWPEKRPTKRGKILVVSVENNMSTMNHYLPKWINRKQELIVIR